MRVVRRTWLMTGLSALVSTVIWWWIGGWSIARRELLHTLLFTPPVWWIMVARLAKPRLWRGVVGGALVGFVTQSAEDVPKVWNLYLQRGTGDGEAQATAVVSVMFYLIIGLWATTLGAVLGLIAVVIQRRTEADTADA